MLHYETVSPNLLAVLRKLMKLPELFHFRLVGGTSLALHIGHRQSVDIDLFTDTVFDNKELQNILRQHFDLFIINWGNKNGFTSMIENVKVDFFNWHLPFAKPPVIEDDLVLMDKAEIAATKLETITGRKEKKDFIDIAFLLKQYSLKEMIEVFRLKYPFISHTFALESLTTFDYADKTEPPVMMQSFSWEETKEFIEKKVNEFYIEQKKQSDLKQQERLRNAEELLKNKKAKPKDD